MMSGELLELVSVSKKFGGVEAIKDVSLGVKKGSITGLIGPNGSGKTTLFNVITGFYAPDSGVIRFKGERIDGLNPNETYALGLVRTFQSPRLFPKLTTLENLLVAPPTQSGEALIHAPWRKTWEKQERAIALDAKAVTEKLHLDGTEGQMVSDLSGAHMKLVESARGLLGGAELLLMDEPAAGVLYSTAREIFDYISLLRREYGLTFFVIEHRLDVLLDYVDYAYVLHLGKLLSKGTPEEVMSDRNVIEAYVGQT
jgi:branched-chain amino acid transport system ATP-binding protein